jgi:DNA-binding IclR family transcriptional regulator
MNYSKTITKALKILNCFTGGNEYKSLSQIAEEVEIEKSTICRFLKTLERDSFIEQDKESKKYRLGNKVLLLGLSILNNLDTRKELIPFMEELNKKYNQTVNLAVKHKNMILYLEVLKGKGYIHELTSVGFQEPLYTTSMGKVFLAGMSSEELEEYFKETEFKKFTKNTITDFNTLKKIIEKVKKDGYASNDEETIDNLCANGVPIKDSGNKIIAAVSVSFLKISVDGPTRKEIIKDLLEVSREASRKFGYYGE